MSTTTEDYYRDAQLPYDGALDDYMDWVMKVEALARKKGFWIAFENDLSGEINRTSDEEHDKELVQAYDNAWYFLVINCSGVALSLLDQQGKNPYSSWNNIREHNYGTDDTDILQLEQDFSDCRMEEPYNSPALWFAKIA